MERYVELFASLRTQMQDGKPAPHKAILLLSMIDLIASGEIKTVSIEKSPALIKRFKSNWETFINDERDKYEELIKSPFNHMKSEGFWFTSRDKKHAYIESSLFFLLRKEETRTTLRNVLIDTYLKQYQPSLTIHKVDFSQLNAAADTTLRPYQVDNKARIYDFWHTGRSVMLQMPTGTGKTRLFVSIVKDLHNWSRQNNTNVKVLLLAHRKELIQQIAQNVNIKYNLSHGIIAAQSPEQREYDIQIGSVPTLTRRLEGWSDKDFDVIIIDEAHHVKADSYKRILQEYPNAKILGVTATPYRLNGAGFRQEFEQLIVSDPVSEFIKKGYLCQYDYFSITPDSNTQKAIESISKFALDGDYLDSALAEVIDTEGVRTNIVHTYLNYANGKKGLVYTINRAHNEHVCKLFNAKGIAAKAIDSQTDLRERQAIVEAFRNGEFQVLCNVNIFSEGFDCPDVEFIQLARPTKSLSMFLQQIGRGLRVADNKPKAIFLDNVGLYNRFGLPSATRNWQKHFDGIEVSEAELKGTTTSSDSQTVQFFDDFTQGNDPVSLIHSSETESESDIEPNSLQLNEPKAINYETDNQEADSDTAMTLTIEEIDEIERDIAAFQRYGQPIPNNLLERKRILEQQLQQERQIAELPHKLKQLATPLFNNLSTPLSITITYDPIEGVIVKKGVPVNSKKKR
ncbi:MAG: DEAD/DEAH box helicase [Tannerellaceae bacterium]